MTNENRYVLHPIRANELKRMMNDFKDTILQKIDVDNLGQEDYKRYGIGNSFDVGSKRDFNNALRESNKLPVDVFISAYAGSDIFSEGSKTYVQYGSGNGATTRAAFEQAVETIKDPES